MYGAPYRCELGSAASIEAGHERDGLNSYLRHDRQPHPRPAPCSDTRARIRALAEKIEASSRDIEATLARTASLKLT
jgi:hypothetical protein